MTSNDCGAAALDFVDNIKPGTAERIDLEIGPNGMTSKVLIGGLDVSHLFRSVTVLATADRGAPTRIILEGYKFSGEPILISGVLAVDSVFDLPPNVPIDSYFHRDESELVVVEDNRFDYKYVRTKPKLVTPPKWKRWIAALLFGAAK